MPESKICDNSCAARSSWLRHAAPEVHPTIVWAKFQAMADGAGIASEKLWAKSRFDHGIRHR